MKPSLTKIIPLKPPLSPNTEEDESLRQFQALMTKNTLPKFTPNSISILINFGFYDAHFYYHAEAMKHNCNTRYYRICASFLFVFLSDNNSNQLKMHLFLYYLVSIQVNFGIHFQMCVAPSTAVPILILEI